MKKIIQSFCIPVLIFLVSVASLGAMEQNSVSPKAMVSDSESLIIDLSTSSSSSSSNDTNIHSGLDSDQSLELLQDNFESSENNEPEQFENIVGQLIAYGSKNPEDGRMLCTILYLREQLIKLFTYEKISSLEELDSERYDTAYVMLNTINIKALELLPSKIQQLLEQLDECFELGESSSSFKSFSFIQGSRHFFAQKVYAFLEELNNFYTLAANFSKTKNPGITTQSIEFLNHLNKLNLTKLVPEFQSIWQQFFSFGSHKYSFLDSKIVNDDFFSAFEFPIQFVFDLPEETLQLGINACQKILDLPIGLFIEEKVDYMRRLSVVISSAQKVRLLLSECKEIRSKDKALWADLDTKNFINDFIDQTSGLKQTYAHIYELVFEKIHASNVSKFSFDLSKYAQDWFAYFFVNKDNQIQKLPFSNKLPKKIFCIENSLCGNSLEQLDLLEQALERNVLFVNQVINYSKESGKKSKKKSRSVGMKKSFEQNLHHLIGNHLSQNLTFKDRLDESLYQAVVECDDLHCLLLSTGLILGKKYGESPFCSLRYLPSLIEKEVMEKDLISLQCTEGMYGIDIGDNDFLRLPDLYTRVVHAYYLERVQDRINQLKQDQLVESQKRNKKKKQSSRKKKRSKKTIDKSFQGAKLPTPDTQNDLECDKDFSVEESAQSIIQEDSLIIVESESSARKEKNEQVLHETFQDNLMDDSQEESVQHGKWILAGRRKKPKKLSPYKKFIQSLQESLSISSDFFYSTDEVINANNYSAIINQPPSSFNKQIGVVLYLQEKNQVSHIKNLKSYARIRKAQNHIQSKKDNFHDFSYRVEDYLEFGHLVLSPEEAAQDLICCRLKKFELPKDCYAILIPGKLLSFSPNFLSDQQRSRILDENQPGEPGVFAGAFVFIFKKHDHTCVHRCFHEAKVIDQEAIA